MGPGRAVGVEAGKKSVPEAGKAADAGTSEPGSLTRRVAATQPRIEGDKEQVRAQAPIPNQASEAPVSDSWKPGKKHRTGEEAQGLRWSGPELLHEGVHPPRGLWLPALANVRLADPTPSLLPQ